MSQLRATLALLTGPPGAPNYRELYESFTLFARRALTTSDLPLDERLRAMWSCWADVLAIVKPATVIGCEVLDHVIVLGKRHLLRLVRQHARYYNGDRPHMSFDRDAPVPRGVEPSGGGRVVAFPRVAGLRHRYSRAA